MFNKKNSNKEKLMKMLGYRPDPSNPGYMYYSFIDVDTSKPVFDDADISDIAFADAQYLNDTCAAANNITKRDIDKSLLADFVKFTVSELDNIGVHTSINCSTIRNLNLDGSYPNENDLEHRIRSIVQDELNNRKK